MTKTYCGYTQAEVAAAMDESNAYLGSRTSGAISQASALEAMSPDECYAYGQGWGRLVGPNMSPMPQPGDPAYPVAKFVEGLMDALGIGAPPSGDGESEGE